MAGRIPMAKVLEQPQRAALYRAILQAPGVEVAALAAQHGIRNSTVLWHIGKLSRAGLVTATQKDGRLACRPVSRHLEHVP